MTCGLALSVRCFSRHFPPQVTGALPVHPAEGLLPWPGQAAQREMQAFVCSLCFTCLPATFSMRDSFHICCRFTLIIVDSCYAVSQAVELSRARAALYFALTFVCWLNAFQFKAFLMRFNSQLRVNKQKDKLET